MAGGSFVRLANFFAKYAKRLEREERRGWLGVQGSTERGPVPLSSHLDSIPHPPHHPLPQGGGRGQQSGFSGPSRGSCVLVSGIR
jgi:hypothetical protein